MQKTLGSISSTQEKKDKIRQVYRLEEFDNTIGIQPGNLQSLHLTCKDKSFKVVNNH
jgi:hypothetical protein